MPPPPLVAKLPPALPGCLSCPPQSWYLFWFGSLVMVRPYLSMRDRS